MYFRTDSTLHHLLLELHERAKPEIAPHLMDALNLMGERSPYKGGRRLQELLEFIEREAEAASDRHTSEGVRDAIAYAAGRLLNDDLDEKYDIYDGSGQDDVRLLERLVSGMNVLAAREIKLVLEQNPNASAADIRAHFEAAGELALRFVKARRAGHYGAFRIRTDGIAWATEVIAQRTGFLSTESRLGDEPRLQCILGQPDPEQLVTAAQIKLRLAHLDEIERAAENAFSKERTFQRLLARSPWLFGGEYVEASGVRRLTGGNEVDIALMRPDGILHVVELKQANVRTVKRHRSVPVPTSEVHDAVAQVASYLRDFDEHRSRILETYGIDARRASGSVVIGHPRFDEGFSEQEINEALRTYTSHLSRIDVITYKQLIDSARRSLQIANPAERSAGEGLDVDDKRSSG